MHGIAGQAVFFVRAPETLEFFVVGAEAELEFANIHNEIGGVGSAVDRRDVVVSASPLGKIRDYIRLDS